MIGPPAFQFYAADYLADERVQLLTLEEEGAYIRLLAYCWREGSIPADTKALAMLAKGADEQVLNTVRTLFTKKPGKVPRLIHKRLELEREKQAEFRDSKRRAGIASGKSRKQKALNNEQVLNTCPTDDPVLFEQKRTLLSSSSSSTSSTKKETSSPKKKRSRKEPKSVDEIIAELQAEPAFAFLDVRDKYNECVAYCHARNEQSPNVQRLTNWLLEAKRRAPLVNGNGHHVLEDKPYLKEYKPEKHDDQPELGLE